MSDIALLARLERISDNPQFCEATKEELRVLVAAISISGRPVSYEALAELAGVSPARAKSSVTLFIEAGILAVADERADLCDEFKAPAVIDRSESVAKEIRDSGLKGLLEDCAEVIGVPTLSTDDVKAITSLYADEGLSLEYILELTAYLASKITNGRRLTSRKIVSEAEKLKEKGIDTEEALGVYLLEKEKEIKDEWEYRKVLGVFGKLSQSERNYIDKWAHKYEFSPSVISKCYDIMRTHAGGFSYQYMDKVLTNWYNAGCKTLEDCAKESEKVGELFKEKYSPADNNSQKTATRVAETPKYSEFNSEDALLKALERSYGTDKKN